MNETDDVMKVAMVAIGIVVLGILLAAGGQITGVTIGPIGVEVAPPDRAETDPVTNTNSPEEPVASQTPKTQTFGIAPESWCLGMREQWTFRKQHFNEDSESIKKSMEENGCFNYPSAQLE